MTTLTKKRSFRALEPNCRKVHKQVTPAAVSTDQLVQIANCLAEYTRLRERYDSYDDFTENASSSIKSSGLYCSNVLETAFLILRK